MTPTHPPGPEALALAVLVSLPKMGPARLRWLLDTATGAAPAGGSGGGAETPAVAAVVALREGRVEADRLPAELVQKWAVTARRVDEVEIAADLDRLGAGLLTRDHPQWPFNGDPDPPYLVFHRGDPAILSHGPRVALVGTRRCTTVGRRVAFELGRDLARAGVTVVSGLASGIDGAAHTGALTLEPPGWAVGVVGTGIDVVYPRANRELWERVGRHGLLLTEAPLQGRPDRWRFPARNRLIAALADVVVVVESHDRGGALLTADEAADRGRTVLAVPGAVTNPAAAGTNQLLADGCPLVRSARDVLDVLGLDPAPGPVGCPEGEPAGSGGPRPARSGDHHGPVAQAILREVTGGEIHVDHLLATTSATVPELLAEIQRLERLGLVHLDGSTVVPGSS